jgi:U3 small nucleolar RNA-associated protein 18
MQDKKTEAALAATLFGSATSPSATPVVSTSIEDSAESVDVVDFEEYSDSDVPEDTYDMSLPIPAWSDSDSESDSSSGGIDITKSGSRLKKLRENMEETNITERELERRLKKRMLEVSERVRAGFTDWANVGKGAGKRINMIGESGEDSSDEEEDDRRLQGIMNSTAPLAMGRDNLPSGEIDMVRGRDLNEVETSKSTVTAVKFHPSSEILFTAGYDKTLRFFRTTSSGTSGQTTETTLGGGSKIHGIHFPDLPILQASWSGGGSRVVCTGRRPFVYLYDVVSGKVDKIMKISGRDEKGWEKISVQEVSLEEARGGRETKYIYIYV